MGCCQSRVKEVEKETTDSKNLPNIIGEEEKMNDNIQPQAATPTPLSNPQVDQPNSEQPLIPNERTVEKPFKRNDKNQSLKSPDTLNTQIEEKPSASFNRPNEKQSTTFGILKEKSSVSLDIEKEKPLVSFDLEKEVNKTNEIIKEKPKMPKKPPKVSYSIKIFIEALEISYKFCDEFGNTFRPFLQFYFYDQIETINIFDKKKIGIQENQDLNKSAEVSEDISFGSKYSERKVIINGKESNFCFKSEIVFFGNESFYFNSIQIYVRNELDHFNPDIKLEPIIIGQARIPINLIENLDKDRIFDGLVEIKLRNIIPIGYLKLIIDIEDIIEDVNQMINKRKITEDIENSNDFKKFLRSNQIIIFDRKVVHFYEMDPLILDKYFFSNKDSFDKRTKQYLFANKIVSDKNIEGKLLQKMYLDSLKESNYVAIYEVYNLLYIVCITEDLNRVLEFFTMSIQEVEFFFNLCHLMSFNPYIIKVFLSFINQFQIIYKKNKASIYKNYNFYNEELILEINYKLIKKLIDILKSNQTNPEYALEIRECVVSVINNLSELINQASIKNDDYKLGKVELPLSQKKKDYTLMYNNCILLMGYRFTIMKIIDYYFEDSLVMNGIFRVFRKACQIITNEGSNLLDKSLIKSTPNEVSTMFRVNKLLNKNLLIEKHDGMFINSLRLMLRKYQHYPELHFNILIVLFQIINNLDNKNLFFTMKKLNLDEFKENVNYFRGNLRAIFKLINSLHLKILAVFSDIILYEKEMTYTDETLQEFFVVVSKIFVGIRSFYRYESHQEHILKDFIEKKNYEIEIHETITRIICNLTVNKQISSLFWEEKIIIDDLINYLTRISNNKNDFIKNTIQRERKNKNVEEIKKIILSICENTLNILYNLMNGIKKSERPEGFVTFIENLNNKYGSRDDILKIFQSVTKTLSYNNLNVAKCDTMIREIEKDLNKHF